MKFTRTYAAIAAFAFMAAVPASAEIISFSAELSGDQEVPVVSTSASGDAELVIDTSTQSISFNVNVTGFGVDELFDTLVAAPVGPVHIHNAPTGVNGPIVVPFAFDPATYVDTADGFTLSVGSLSFADAVAISGSALSFDDFVAALIAGDTYVNIHTDLFNGGELRGQLSQVPLPGALVLFATGLAAFASRTRHKKQLS